MPNVRPFVWLSALSEETVAFYLEAFEGATASNVVTIDSPDGPSVMMATISLPGMDLMLFNGGPFQAPNEAISFFVDCESQAEVDRLWDHFRAGGEGGRCGWVTDPYGVTWQVVPSRLGELMGGPDPERSNRVRQAMLSMNRLDIAALQAAYDAEERTE